MTIFSTNMAKLACVTRCRMDRAVCPHGCEPQSPNCLYNLEPSTVDSRCPYQRLMNPHGIRNATKEAPQVLARKRVGGTIGTLDNIE